MLKQILGDWKPKWYENRWRITLIALPIGAIVVPLLFLALPYLEILNDMAVQPKAKAQGQYGWFSDEQIISERAPVAGTVPFRRGSEPIDTTPYAVLDKDAEKAAKKAGETLINPIPSPPTKEVMARGQFVFEKICITCHGARGEGDGGIVGPDLFPAPPSWHTEQARGYPMGRVFHIITVGQNKMPSYADVLTVEERWSAVHFFRAMQLAKKLAEERAK